MIGHAVRLVAARLEAHLRARFGIAEDIVGRMRTVAIDAGALPAGAPIHAPETRAAEVGA